MITVIIPTISSQRIGTLIKTVESIQAGIYKDVHVIVISDGNPEIFDVAQKRLKGITVLLNEARIGWRATINKMLLEVKSEYYIYASDDLIFPRDCISSAMKAMLNNFPDGDGVISIGKKNRCAFGLMGSKFADRFPDRQVFCPDYFHYGGDSELWRTVQALECFAYAPERESQVKHSRLKDECWRLARKKRGADLLMFRIREERGLSWGVDFALLNN